ncbi:aminotransferase class I/II-fold pyridoxal phosphate-dependent enzyme [Sphingomonas sp. GC_Shp_1]|uniref:aminotransferase class I/II-fold pyridoxal phosphate-dependent enzyme n=1 Tax=unclassified Sphingomonas TaxID=196159 RepID=UPI0031F8F7EC
MSGADVDGLMVHGGRLDEAGRRFPAAPLPWLDLSTGINPWPWDGATAAIDLRRLPSPDELAALERAAAESFGVGSTAIAALPGSEIGLRLLAPAGVPAPYHVVAPGYRTHAEALPGARAITPAELDAAAETGGTILLANPNNPDGRTIAPERLLALAATLATRGGWLVIDEAFADAAPPCSILPHLHGDEPVVVMRSFGKFFGLAGVRLGFACGHPTMVEAIRARLGSWPISATAIAVGTAAYRDRAWAATMRAGLVDAVAGLDAMLHSHGFDPVGDSPLFRLIATDDAATLFMRLASAGILTRRFDYASGWLRLGLPDGPAALARLDAALRDS